MNISINKTIKTILIGATLLIPLVSYADSLPPTGGNNDGATAAPTDSSLPPTGGNNDGATAAPATPAPVTPPSTTSGSSGSFYGGSSGSVVSIITSTATTSATTSPLLGSCPLINTFMQIGTNNNTADVLKLQAFLKTTEQLDVDLSGIFDTKTEAGVKTFQAKYLSDVMGPWSATAPSGKVYITTKKKINEIACNTPLNLTPDELAIINSYIQGNQNNSSTTGTVGPNAPTTTHIIGENSSNSSNNAASVVNAPVLQRIWNFIKGIFGR